MCLKSIFPAFCVISDEHQRWFHYVLCSSSSWKNQLWWSSRHLSIFLRHCSKWTVWNHDIFFTSCRQASQSSSTWEWVRGCLELEIFLMQTKNSIFCSFSWQIVTPFSRTLLFTFLNLLLGMFHSMKSLPLGYVWTRISAGCKAV